MKKIYLIFLLALLPGLSFGQKYARTIDSIAKTAISKLGGIDKMKFQLLMRHMQSMHLYKRIDSVKCDYVYVESITNHRDTSIAEWYFNTPYQGKYFVQPELKNVLPSLVFQDGKEMDFRLSYFSKTISGVTFENIYEKYFTLEEIKKRVKDLKSLQELTYDKTVAMTIHTQRYSSTDSSGSKNFEEKSQQTKMAEKLLVNELKVTHKIIVWIDKKTKSVKVSLQTPAKSPEIDSYPVNVQYQQW